MTCALKALWLRWWWGDEICVCRLLCQSAHSSEGEESGEEKDVKETRCTKSHLQWSNDLLCAHSVPTGKTPYHPLFIHLPAHPIRISIWLHFSLYHFARSVLISFIFLFTRFIHSYLHTFVNLFVKLFIVTFTHSFIHSFIRSFIRAFIQSCIH